MSRVFVFVLAVGLVAGCSGPTPSLDVSVREVPSDIVLGTPEAGAPAPAPVPPAVPVVVGPGLPPSLLRPPPSGPVRTTTTQPPPACPRTDPLAAPKRVALNRVSEAPPAGSLPFRVDGEFSVSGADPRSGRFPPESTRTVGNIKGAGRGFTYDVAAELAGTTTTTGYQVITDSSVPGEAGLYVTFVDTVAPSGATARFRPTLPLKLVEFPMVANSSVTSAGTDPVSGTTVSWTTTVRGKERVAACGTPLDSIVVELDGGRVDGPQTNVDFTATYRIATQFGGLSISDDVEVSGREGLDTVSRTIKSIVSVDPGRPG